MLLAILLITIFNTGLIVLMAGAMLAELKKHNADTAKCINDNTDKGLAEALTAIYNMDSIKQKVDMSGKAEL